MNETEQVALWRRHFDVLDQLVYGFLEGHARAQLSDQQRAQTRSDERAVVSLDELQSRRYELATVLYYGAGEPAGFRASDPTDTGYVGRVESCLLRDRREFEGEL